MMELYLQRSNVRLPVLVCVLLLVSSCMTTQRTEETIEDRVTARWNAVLSGDLVSAYEFLSPGYRSSVTVEQYQRSVLGNRVKWNAARYIGSDCAETTCKVKISLDYVLYGALPGVKSFEGSQSVDESWVSSDGKWYFVPDK